MQPEFELEQRRQALLLEVEAFHHCTGEAHVTPMCPKAQRPYG